MKTSLNRLEKIISNVKIHKEVKNYSEDIKWVVDFRTRGFTLSQIALAMGKSRSWVQKILKLAKSIKE